MSCPNRQPDAAAPEEGGQKPWIEVVKTGDESLAIDLLRADRTLIRAHPECLYYAVVRASPKLVKELLAAGADPNSTAVDGIAPALVAVRLGFTDIFDAFLEHDNIVNSGASRSDPLDFHKTTRDELSKIGGISMYESAGRTFLHLAVETKSLGTLQYLLDRLPRIDVRWMLSFRDADRCTPLELARMLNSSPEVRETLIAAYDRLRVVHPDHALDQLRDAASTEDRQEWVKAMRARVTACVRERELEELRKQSPVHVGEDGIPPYEPTDLFKQFCPTLPQKGPDGEPIKLIRDDWRGTVKKLHSCGVFSVDLFTPEGIAALQEEFERVTQWSRTSGVPLRRPNSMNNYGFVLGDAGYNDWLAGLTRAALADMAKEYNATNVGWFLKEEMAGTPAAMMSAEQEQMNSAPLEFKSIHAFTIRYRLGEDTHLATHVDNSDFTYNLCLDGNFEGATLYFKDQACSTDVLRFDHKVGTAVFHRGQIPHGAEQLIRGFRTNMVLWAKTDANGYSDPVPLNPKKI